MALTSAPAGFRPVLNQTGQSRANTYAIASAYGTQLSYGDPVMLATDGTITALAATTSPILGVFAGCEYIDATGKPTVSKHWPAGQTILAGTTVTAYVYDDQTNLFDVQVTANASGYVQAAIGDQTNVYPVTAGNAATGQSNAGLALALVGAGVQGQVRVMALVDGPYDATYNPYPIVRVQISRHAFSAAMTAI